MGRNGPFTAWAAALVAACVLTLTSTAGAASATPAQIADEQAIRQCVNTVRVALGLVPLRYHPALSRAARLQARFLTRTGSASHVDAHGRAPADRVALYSKRFGRGVGENVEMGAERPAVACWDWLLSAPHRRNMFNPDYRYMGSGVATRGSRKAWVKVFALRPVR